MSYNYVVTAYKGTAVTAVQTGNFTGPEDINLIQAKGSSLAVSVVTPEGLKPVADASIYGRISLMRVFRPKGESQDLLFFMTARYHLAVVSYDSASGDIVTRAYGDMKERVGRPTEGPQIGIVDPDGSVIALHIYCGMIKIVPLELDSTEPLTAFNIRLDDLMPVDMCFLKNTENNKTVALITEDSTGRYLKLAIVSVQNKELVKPFKPSSIESQASLLHPLSSGGVLVVGSETLAVYGTVHHAVDFPILKDCIISCVGAVDSSRYLLGDANGRLLMLFIETEQAIDTEQTNITMKLEVLGETVSPSCIAYLDNGVTFIGSCLGDSQLCKLSSAADESGSYVEILETFTCLAPILDMSVVDVDQQGRDVVVTCSGYGRNGSLRLVRSGVGINEQASIDLAGVKGVWSLHCGTEMAESDNTLVLAFVRQTTVLSLKGEEVEETELDGIAADQQTHYCSNVIGNKILQITGQSVRLINEETLQLVSKWTPPSGKGISAGSCAGSHVVVVVGNELFCLDIQESSVNQLSHVTLEHEIACVDVRVLKADSGTSNICAVGLWTNISAKVLRLPSFDALHTQPLGGDILPRSILVADFGTRTYLLVALGDGTLHYFQMDPDSGALSNGKKVVLGTKPIVLRQFISGDNNHVFACSNHPTIIHWNNHKLLFSNVNLKEVNYICTLNSDSFRDCLALVDDNTLTIGSLDQLQMLHIHTVPLAESPRRISHQRHSHTFLVASCRVDVPNGDKTALISPKPCASKSVSNMLEGTHPDDLSILPVTTTEELEVFSLLLFDENSLEVIHGYQLSPREHVTSLTSCVLDSTHYYAVGTAFVDPTEKEPNRGRVLLFRVSHTKVLELVYMNDEAGAVYQVVQFHDKLLISVNSEVRLYKWEEGKMVLECSFSDTILALYLKCKGDFILVGDLMRSFKLLVYKAEKSVLEEISVETSLNPVFMTAMEMIDDENYLGADGRHIFVCQKNSEAAVEADLMYMLQPSRMYIGDNINVFRRGSLVMEHPGASPSPIQGKPIIYGSVHGAVGLVVQLDMSTFSVLAKLQENMAVAIKSVGNIEHEVYRCFSMEHTAATKTKSAEGFIDGDLVEHFLDLPQEKMEQIIKGIKKNDAHGMEVDVTVEDLVKLIEDLSRIH